MKIKINNRKMKKSVYKPGTLLSLAALLLLSVSLNGQEVTRSFHKEYKADAKTTLSITNRYGDIGIESWANNQIVIDVKVVVELPDRSRAEKLISYIDVQFNESENSVSARTVIDDKFNFSGWGGGTRRFRIDYTIKMPASSNLTLVNRYGDTEIDELAGQVNIDIKYGDLTADKLTRGNEKPLSKINMAYGKASIDQAGWLDLYLRYSNPFEIDKSQALLVDSRYSKLILGETSSVVGESRYGNLEIQKVKNLVLNVGYIPVNVGELTGKLNLQGSYGSLSVEKIPAGFESLEADVSYMGVRLGIDESASYNLDAHSSYGSIKFNEEKFKHEKHIVENNSTTVTGIVGSEAAPTSKVKISASYGQIKLY
jgi:hypothetical protein